MLKVTVELYPGGNPFNAKYLGHAVIDNVSDLNGISDYKCRVSENANPFTGKRGKIVDVNIKKHDRNQSVWELVYKVVKEARTKLK